MDRKTFGHRRTTPQFVILSPTNTTGDNPLWSLPWPGLESATYTYIKEHNVY